MERREFAQRLVERLSGGTNLFDVDYVPQAHGGFLEWVGAIQNLITQMPDHQALLAEWIALPSSPLAPFQAQNGTVDPPWQLFHAAVQARLDWLARLIRSLTSEPSESSATNLPQVADPAAVFVVHGRDANQRAAMFTFLRSLGLHPLEFNEARAATGKATPYVGEILDAAFKVAQAVVVVLTGDDEARLREALRSPGDPPHETTLSLQARPNVLFEAGMAMGRDPDRTIIVEVGVLRPFSDIGGRHTLRFDGSTQRRQELADRLETAGCPVNRKGTDWHTAGEFSTPEIPQQRVRTSSTIERVTAQAEPELSHEQHRILTVVANNRRADSSTLADATGLTVVEVEHELDVLRKQDLLVDVINTLGDERKVGLTDQGRSYVVDHRLQESRV